MEKFIDSDIVVESFERNELQKAEGYIKLEHGFVTIPLPGICVLPHVTYGLVWFLSKHVCIRPDMWLWKSLIVRMDLLKINPLPLSSNMLIGKYIQLGHQAIQHYEGVCPAYLWSNLFTTFQEGTEAVGARELGIARSGTNTRPHHPRRVAFLPVCIASALDWNTRSPFHRIPLQASHQTWSIAYFHWYGNKVFQNEIQWIRCYEPQNDNSVPCEEYSQNLLLFEVEAEAPIADFAEAPPALQPLPHSHPLLHLLQSHPSAVPTAAVKGIPLLLVSTKRNFWRSPAWIYFLSREGRRTWQAWFGFQCSLLWHAWKVH